MSQVIVVGGGRAPVPPRTSSDLPDVVFDERGNRYEVVKPHVPDADCWVRLYQKKEPS